MDNTDEPQQNVDDNYQQSTEDQPQEEEPQEEKPQEEEPQGTTEGENQDSDEAENEEEHEAKNINENKVGDYQGEQSDLTQYNTEKWENVSKNILTE